MLPYKSKAQAAKFHVLEKQGKISHKVVEEWDQASEGTKLPERIGHKSSPTPHKRSVTGGSSGHRSSRSRH